MPIRLEQECPQCAAPLELEETDRLLPCTYCGVDSYLANPENCRMVLPAKTQVADAVYAPYMHFKGVVYTCDESAVNFRMSETTRLGSPLPFLPVSLGLRPQTMKIRFLTSSQGGMALKNTLNWESMSASLAGGQQLSRTVPLHQAYIGEVLNTIYLPLSIRDGALYDEVLDRPVAELPAGQDDIFASHVDAGPGWQPHFLASLCPNCGWKLQGSRDSVVLFCHNCTTAWATANNRFSPVAFAVQPGDREKDFFLPFWRIPTTMTAGIDIRSFADFLRLTNQPLTIRPEWEDQAMHFQVPAFKIRPESFLRLATQTTISQNRFSPSQDNLADKKIHAVTLPQSEAVQALKVILAHSTLAKKNVFPHLAESRVVAQSGTLVLLPFGSTSHEFVQGNTGIAVNKKNLEFGRTL